ncbi:MAG: rRNA adenine dimethyltransferase family protein [Parcubacteria group bacterium]
MKPKKSLGQNFLKDKAVLERIIESANLSTDDFVVEIGSGEGVLTEELVKHAGKVLAIEIDKNLATKLDSRFRGNDKVKIINDDILKVNLPEMLRHSERNDAVGGMESKNLLNNTTSNNQGQIPRLRSDKILTSLGMTDYDYKVIANIPYYITSPIIQLFLETKYPPTEMILMVQKEVAERIVASPGQMSILAVSVQYYADVKLLFYVDKKAFWPVPEVDSAVIRIEVRSKKKEVSQEENKKFFRIVKAGFSSKRKTLLNNLSSSFHLGKSETEEKIKKAGINPTCRAQELTIENWKKLSSLF